MQAISHVLWDYCHCDQVVAIGAHIGGGIEAQILFARIGWESTAQRRLQWCLHQGSPFSWTWWMSSQYLPHRNDQDFFLNFVRKLNNTGKGANNQNVLGRTRVQLPFYWIYVFGVPFANMPLIYFFLSFFLFFWLFGMFCYACFFQFPFCSVCLSSLNKWISCLETAESSSVAGLSSLSNILRTQHPCHQFCNRLFCLNLCVFSPQYV